jgi:MFS family permease
VTGGGPRALTGADVRGRSAVRFGPRRVLTIIVTYWSVMTAATAAATGAVSFVIIRFLFGVGEAGAFPGATCAMQLWYPREERGFVQGITHSAFGSKNGAIADMAVLTLRATRWGNRPARLWITEN